MRLSLIHVTINFIIHMAWYKRTFQTPGSFYWAIDRRLYLGLRGVFILAIKLYSQPCCHHISTTKLVHTKQYSRQQISALVDWKQVLFIRKNSYIHSNNKFSFRLCFFSLATNIKSIFSTAVDRFNEAGCLQWIPRTTETEYIRVVGNEAR